MAGGSTGYGAPGARLYGQWRLVDVADCAAAAMHLVERGLCADAARLVIRGGSAGGLPRLPRYDVLSLFKAGASFCNVGDLMLLAKDTWPESRYLDQHYDRTLAASTRALRRALAGRCIGQLRCPVIFQGEDSKTVPAPISGSWSRPWPRGACPSPIIRAGEGHGFRKAETLRRVLELRTRFLRPGVWLHPTGPSKRVEIANIPAREAKQPSLQISPAAMLIVSASTALLKKKARTQ